MEFIVIECKNCYDYVNALFERWEISKEEIEKVLEERHKVKKCKIKIDSFLDWLEFGIKNQEELQQENNKLGEWNNGYLKSLNDAKRVYLYCLQSQISNNPLYGQ